MGVNPSDVPPWVHEYGPKVVAGLEKTAEQVAKLAGMLRGMLEAANQPRSVTIFTPWLTNPEAVANDRSHDDDPERLYREAWEEIKSSPWKDAPYTERVVFRDDFDATWKLFKRGHPGPNEVSRLLDDANDRSHADSDPTEEAYRLAWEMNKQKRITRFDDFAKIAKGLMDFNGSNISDITMASWEALPSYVQAAWRRHVNIFIFGKESAPNEAPSAR